LNIIGTITFHIPRTKIVTPGRTKSCIIRQQTTNNKQQTELHNYGKPNMGDVKILTAGGAAKPGRKGIGKVSRRTHNKNKQKNDTTVVDSADARGSSDLPEGEKKNTHAFQNVYSNDKFALEFEESETEADGIETNNSRGHLGTDTSQKTGTDSFPEDELVTPVNIDDLYQEQLQNSKTSDLFWLFICFIGIMASFVCYGLLLEYTTSGGRKLHELSFLFVTSGLYTITAAAGRYVRGEVPTTIPPSRFAILGLTSMGSTFTSVRSLRFVIYPIQVLAKSCKPVPVMLMGTLMGKRYDLRKYINVVMIVIGVALFMGGGDKSKGNDDDEKSNSSQFLGIILLFFSLCFDGGTGAYEDKLMSVHSVQPFDLMYNIQLGKTILAGVSLLVSLIHDNDAYYYSSVNSISSKKL
jgi:drug/metabolite transporter (DMT)-like permease